MNTIFLMTPPYIKVLVLRPCVVDSAEGSELATEGSGVFAQRMEIDLVYTVAEYLYQIVRACWFGLSLGLNMEYTYCYTCEPGKKQSRVATANIFGNHFLDIRVCISNSESKVGKYTHCFPGRPEFKRS